MDKYRNQKCMCGSGLKFKRCCQVSFTESCRRSVLLDREKEIQDGYRIALLSKIKGDN